MYIPPHFREEREDVLHDAIRRIGLATLVTQNSGGVEANHLPLLLEDGVLRGHFARANPVWKSLKPGAEVLAIFLGPHAYVSPSWYPSKAQTGKAVPTWNYITVHVRGRLTLRDDPIWLRRHVGALSAAHEAARTAPWSVADAPADYIDGLLGAIVGFEISITRLEGKWKLSQNRSAADIEGVRAALARNGDAELAALMPK
ncbi:MAG TPA: FMN-binding negative transcriptional regulator [Rhizomicrobium sp.]|jgi:transcriptional regulator|nr:FMN-binding negative transcriptional regulator [Rhizomicrobium sp.]